MDLETFERAAMDTAHDPPLSGGLVLGELPRWMHRARCADADPTMFWPIPGSSAEPAKALCRTCPVIDRCLDYALCEELEYGIWGGTSENERKALTRERAA